MNKPQVHPRPPAAPAATPKAGNITPPPITIMKKPDARVPAPQPEHEILPRKNSRAAGPHKAQATREHDPITPPLKAARGDDDLMSQQPMQTLPGTDTIKAQWKQQVGAAKIAWGKLTEDELLECEGREQKLAGLVQERYSLTREQADQQIRHFFRKHTA